ncbi:restriction endonuclease [Streptomyces sp. NPDC101249]|uniref:restriction endonuclease n=1 Tax=Streptomyces sp. NPDC101249 TaxID=3366140 RepID=UPI0038233B0A
MSVPRTRGGLPPRGRQPVRRRGTARRPARGPVRRRRRAEDRLIGGFLGAVVAVAGVLAVVDWLLTHRWVLVAVVAVAVTAGAALHHRRRQRARWEAVRMRGLRYELTRLDGLHHTRFEDAVGELMRRDGCADAVRVGGRGDLGADVKATDPFGRRWVIQCKHRRDGLAGSAVGTPDLQVLNGTARQVHGADIAVIVTNGRVTAPAAAFARQQRLHVVDRHTLGAWASGSRPLWDLLRSLPAPRGPYGGRP